MPVNPYLKHKYEVEVDGFVRAGFSKVSGLKHTIEIAEYREGGENETPQKLPGQSSFDNITLERGLSDDPEFINWMQLIFNLDESDGNQGDDNFRKTINIYIKDKSGRRVKQWTVYRAWPSEFTHPDLDASAMGEVAIESLVITNEGVKPTIL
jgi:phage tail-like protein